MTFSVTAGATQIKQKTLPVPLEPCSLKVSVSEGNEAVYDSGAHICETLDFLGVDQVPHCPSSAVFSDVSVRVFFIVGHTP